MKHNIPVALSSLSLLVTLAACGSGGGPTDPAGPGAALSTAYGTASVETNGNDFDPGAAVAAVDRAYARARGQVGSRIDGIRIDGLKISIREGQFNGAVGQYHPGADVIEMAAGVERVIDHELQHRFCHALGNSGSCCTLQDHPGGYDLTCSSR